MAPKWLISDYFQLHYDDYDVVIDPLLGIKVQEIVEHLFRRIEKTSTLEQMRKAAGTLVVQKLGRALLQDSIFCRILTGTPPDPENPEEPDFTLEQSKKHLLHILIQNLGIRFLQYVESSFSDQATVSRYIEWILDQTEPPAPIRRPAQFSDWSAKL